MEFPSDSRAFLNFDDECYDSNSKFTLVESSLSKSCDRLEIILRKISRTKRRLRQARDGDEQLAIVMYTNKLRMLGALYDLFYDTSAQQSDQLQRLEGHRHTDNRGSMMIDEIQR